MAVKSETELYIPVKMFLQARGFDVKGEVNQCDMVAIKEDEEEPIIVELKKSMNLSLVLQGLERQKLSDLVYLAIEQTGRTRTRLGQHRSSQIEAMCHKLGLGLITVQFFKTKQPRVEIVCEPGSPVTVRKAPRKKMKLLQEFRDRSGDYNVGGSTRVKLLTAYRERALRCAALLDQHGELSPRQIRDALGEAKVAAILQQNYYKWFTRVRRGVYALTPLGKEALNQYEQVTSDKSLHSN